MEGILNHCLVRWHLAIAELQLLPQGPAPAEAPRGVAGGRPDGASKNSLPGPIVNNLAGGRREAGGLAQVPRGSLEPRGAMLTVLELVDFGHLACFQLMHPWPTLPSPCSLQPPESHMEHTHGARAACRGGTRRLRHPIP